MRPHGALVNRRGMLRLGGLAAAGAAGAAVASAVSASPADAASGDNLIIGNTGNNAGTDETILTSSTLSNPTLTVKNTAGGGNGRAIKAFSSTGTALWANSGGISVYAGILPGR